jgi:glycosyltransferase involved in cell wall biosynthesis
MTRQRPPSLSLIVATIGRSEELVRLLRSIDAQRIPDMELIIVDQNTDDKVQHLLNGTTTVYKHVRSPRGLSRARNAGLIVASGTIVGFPDDDCWYPEGVLQQVIAWFDCHLGQQFLCCPMRDETGAEVAARWPSRSQRVDKGSVLRVAASGSLFIRREAILKIGGFDEQIGLGAGTRFQSGEDTDLLIRCLSRAGSGWFERSFYVHHPSRNPESVTSDRALAYGLGFGYILRKHGYSVLAASYHVIRALGGMTKSIFLLRHAEARFYLHSARGRWKGYTQLVR